MSISFRQGDITSILTGSIAHGVNCQNVMGSGVAKALYEKWPAVKDQYHALGKERMFLGRVQQVVVEPLVTVFNCFTQEYYGRDPRKVYANYYAIEHCLHQIPHSNFKHTPSVNIPKIGCGLGGLLWCDVYGIVEEIDRIHGSWFNIVVWEN